jgi:hypothetical protein
MNAIAYINTRDCSIFSEYNVQEKSILRYCSINGLQLVKIFHETGSGDVRQYDAWKALDNFLRKQKTQLGPLVVHSSKQLGNDLEEITDKLIFLREVYHIKVLCLDERFIAKVVEKINAIKQLDVIKKQLSELMLKYLITFRTRQVSFTVQSLCAYCNIDSALLQSNETGDALDLHRLDFKTIKLHSFWVDPDQYLSLFESTLRMLMSLSIIRSEYLIFSSVSHSSECEKPVHNEFFVQFSDQFWNEFEAFV